jgi:hypothetical protein
MRTLKDFGFGKTSLGTVIQSEAVAVGNVFASHKGKPFNLDLSLDVGILNVIWKMCAGQQYDHQDKEILSLLKNIQDVDIFMDKLGLVQRRPELIPYLPKYRKLLEQIKSSVDCIMQHMKVLISILLSLIHFTFFCIFCQLNIACSG